MKVDLIILNFLTYEDTYENIVSLEKNLINENLDLQLIVVDNLSDKNKLMELKSKLKSCKFDIKYIPTKENLGFAKGMNLGIEHSRKNFVICSNNDIVYYKPFDIEKMTSIYNDKKDIGVIGPSIVNLNGEYQNPYIVDDVDWNITKRKIKNFLFFKSKVGYILYYLFSLKNEIVNKNKTAKKNKPESMNVYALHGAYFILTPGYFRYFEGLDENTFLFSEELILAERVKSKGLKEYYFSDEEVLHKEDSATDSLLRSGIKKINFIFRENYKSKKYFFKEYIWKK